MYRKPLRIAAMLLALSVFLSLCGCTSIFTDIVLDEDVDEEERSVQNWDTTSYGSQMISSYPSGKDAFYIDEEKCIKSEIEEFHLLSLSGDETLYYFTAPTNPEYNGVDKNTGYYCLATYDFENNIYTALEEGFYKKEAGSVSMASDFDAEGNGMACIGDTFLYICNMTIQKKFDLSEDDKASIKEDVGGEYLCFDIALADVAIYSITAAFMRVPSADSDEETEDEFKSSLYSITFDVSEEPTHTIIRLSGSLDGSVGNLCSSFSDLSDILGMTYCHKKSEEQDSVTLSNYLYKEEILEEWFTISLQGKDEDESLKGFTTCTDSMNNSFLLMLYDDRLELWQIELVPLSSPPLPMGYENVSSIRLDDSPSYMSLDEIPSVAVNSSKMIYTCSMTKGFRQFKLDSSGKTTTTTFANGAYYAAYSADGGTCTLIGFNDTSHKVTTNTYKNGKLTGSRTRDEEYSLNDLPYAKVYSTYVGANNYPINTTVSISAGAVGGQGAPPPPTGG